MVPKSIWLTPGNNTHTQLKAKVIIWCDEKIRNGIGLCSRFHCIFSLSCWCVNVNGCAYVCEFWMQGKFKRMLNHFQYLLSNSGAIYKVLFSSVLLSTQWKWKWQCSHCMCVLWMNMWAARRLRLDGWLVGLFDNKYDVQCKQFNTNNLPISIK